MMTRILVFDNYDSFTYNLVHMVEKMPQVKVDLYLNDQIPLEKIKKYDKVILSPGPGIPSEAGLLLPLIREYAAVKPILGVCLGHQAIGEAFGARLLNLDTVFHGVAVPLSFVSRSSPILEGISEGEMVGRYHSWVIDPVSIPDVIQVTATDTDGMVMGIQHREYDVQGVQFHPESVLTPCGEHILRNWVKA